MQKGREVQKLAMQYRPDDLEVQVLRESVTGAVTMEVFGYEIANAFNNLTNVLVVMTPNDPIKAQNKAVLINGHYDSTLGTVGASDCASCVAVGMEIARTIASNTPDQMPVLSPLVFLFNGGEETLMQASYGFMTFSPLAQNLGAFINIESTGPGGPDIVFQHTGDWALEAYARVAPYPRGSSIAQDFFDAGIIPADTDFRMFSHKHQGSLSGIDTAQVFDGTAYHTARDEVDRIRDGTLQAMGENVLATVIEYSRVLHSTNVNNNKSNKKPSHQPLVFYDIFARYMVVYPASIADIIHHIPLLVLLLSILVFSSKKRRSGKVEEEKEKMRENGEKKDTSAHTTTITTTTTTYTIIMPSVVYKGVGLSILSILGTLLIPAMMGSLTTLVYGGIPMPWYGEKDLAMCIFVPAALVGLLLPYITLISNEDNGDNSGKGATKPPCSAMAMMQSLCLGAGLFFAVVCSLLTIFDMQSSFLFALWSGGTAVYGALLVLLSLSKKYTNSYSTTSIILLLLPHCIPLSVVSVSSLSLSYHIMEKVGLAGSLTGIAGKIVADCVVGVVTGFSVYLTAGTLVPVFIVGGLGIDGGGGGINRLMREKRATSPSRILIAILMGMSVGASIFAADRCKGNHHPYSYKHPKRILIQHIHKERRGGGGLHASSSIWSAAAIDSIPVDIALPPSFVDLPPVDFNDEDWAALYPLNYLVTGLAREAPGAEVGAVWPDLRLIDQDITTTTKHNDDASSYVSSSYRRLHLELDTVKPAWAVLNITGNVVHWSLNDKVAHTDSDTVHMVRYASKVYTTTWSFWLDVEVDESVIIKVYVKHLDETEELRGVVREVPEWVSPIAVTTWQFERHF